MEVQTIANVILMSNAQVILNTRLLIPAYFTFFDRICVKVQGFSIQNETAVIIFDFTIFIGKFRIFRRKRRQNMGRIVMHVR